MKNRIYIVCFVLLLLSCSKERELEVSNDGRVPIVLRMKPTIDTPNSRAIESGDNSLNENKIENLHVFIFPQNATDLQTNVYYEAHSGLSFQGTGVFSTNLEVFYARFSAGATYDIYTVANLPTDVVLPNPITLGALKSLRTLTPIVATGVQSNFVMDGKVSAILNPTVPTSMINVDVPLKRAVSKVRIKFNLAQSAGVSSATTLQLSLKNYAKYGALLDGNPLVLTGSGYGQTSYVSGVPTTQYAFYCYENNWGTTTANETYIMVNLPYVGRPSNYYKIPINKYTTNSTTGRIERNMIYDITAYIDKDGAESESGAVTVSGNCIITNWTTREVVLKTINQHYLGISEYNIVMANTASFTLNYVSDLPISVVSVTAGCTQYSSTGVASTIAYTVGQSQFPTFTVNAATSTITINSTVPINYVPKNMTFVVTNGLGLSLSATIVQYPTRYVTARLSSGNVRPEWVEGGTNLNLFTVNTLVPSANGSYTLGDPTNGFAKTDSTANGSKMVSPRFIIASQYGIYNRVTYSVAQTRCFTYGEDIYRSGWRMPTKAEIELVNAIQDDPNSAVKALLTGDAYWSAYKYDYYNFTNNSWVSVNNTGTAFIRAVYDIYKDEL